jgi:hypothetical protein
MKKIMFIGILFPFISFAQIENKIEGIIINSPCELEYTRNLGNQNNYSCVLQDVNDKIINYSMTISNLFKEMNGLTASQLAEFKNHYLTTAKKDAEKNNEATEYIVLSNGIKALKINSTLTYSGQKFVVTSIVFLYKQKGFVVNLTTNNLQDTNSTNLAKRIIFN